MNSILLGCGDVGRRIAKKLTQAGVPSECIYAYVKTAQSAELAAKLNVIALRVDLDDPQRDMSLCEACEVYYTVPPQKQGVTDERSRTLTAMWEATQINPSKVVVISTTGVYGDCSGDWVDETEPVNPQTERGKRRADAEKVWFEWGATNKVPVVILRVPGIYAYSRIPRERLSKRTPVVNAEECGFTNRIHADDLAQICVGAMHRGHAGGVYNVSDGVPGKISEYLQAAAHTIGLDPLPEITMQQAQGELSDGMLSYLRESRKIDNQKMLKELQVQLLYPDFRRGLRY